MRRGGNGASLSPCPEVEHMFYFPLEILELEALESDSGVSSFSPSLPGWGQTAR